MEHMRDSTEGKVLSMKIGRNSNLEINWGSNRYSSVSIGYSSLNDLRQIDI